MRAERLELEARPRDEVANRPRYQDLMRRSQVRDASRNVKGEPGNLLLLKFALTRMQANPDVNSQRLGRFHDRACALNRPGGPVEDGDKAVAGRVHFLAFELGEL